MGKFRTLVTDASRVGLAARDALRGAVALVGDAAGHDPASGQFTSGTHVRVHAEGVKGHGSQGHVSNHPEKAGGRHFVTTGTGETHGPFHAHQLQATGKAAAPSGARPTLSAPRLSRVTRGLLR